MTRSPKPLALAGLVVALAFVWGLWQLFSIRFEAGDVYPAYSSLRADPVGAKALYDGFSQLDGVRTGRNYRPLERLELDQPDQATVFWLGGEYDVQPEASWRDFLRQGGRLVAAWAPSQFYERVRTNTAAGPLPWQQARYRRGPLLPREPLSQKPEDVAFREQWQVDLGFVPLPGGGAEFKSDTATLVASLPLPAELAWHSTVCFTNLHSDWRVIYERQGRPVMIERRVGAGTVVLSTDAWPVSNEALRSDRQTALLTWFAGGRARLIFDELHLGVESSPGLASMMRRYRMQGIVAAFLALALLFLWRNAATFLPRQRSGPATAADVDIAGRDAASGFVNLLRRAIKPADLPALCLTEWKHGLASAGGCSKERLDRMEKLLLSFNDTPPGQRSVLATYRELHRIWKEQK